MDRHYTGDWQFYFYVPNDLQTLDFWDGDLDRGSNSVLTYADTDDPNFDGKPEWAGPFTCERRHWRHWRQRQSSG